MCARSTLNATLPRAIMAQGGDFPPVGEEGDRWAQCFSIAIDDIDLPSELCQLVAPARPIARARILLPV
jgi:truncated hemoglobin YjbI